MLLHGRVLAFPFHFNAFTFFLFQHTLILYKAGYFICICEGECHTTCLPKMIVWTVFWSEIFF